MTVSIKKVSRLQFAEVQEVGGYTFFDRTQLPVISSAADDLRHVVEDSDRIDLLANKYYGVPDLWWVIARANNMRLIPRDLCIGDVIAIPSRERVFTKILQTLRL